MMMMMYLKVSWSWRKIKLSSSLQLDTTTHLRKERREEMRNFLKFSSRITKLLLFSCWLLKKILYIHIRRTIQRQLLDNCPWLISPRLALPKFLFCYTVLYSHLIWCVLLVSRKSHRVSIMNASVKLWDLNWEKCSLF
jgi:hypothetical protein